MEKVDLTFDSLSVFFLPVSKFHFPRTLFVGAREPPLYEAAGESENPNPSRHP